MFKAQRCIIFAYYEISKIHTWQTFWVVLIILEKSRSGIIRMTSTAFNDILVDHALWEKSY